MIFDLLLCFSCTELFTINYSHQLFSTIRVRLYVVANLNFANEMEKKFSGKDLFATRYANIFSPYFSLPFAIMIG